MINMKENNMTLEYTEIEDEVADLNKAINKEGET